MVESDQKCNANRPILTVSSFMYLSLSLKHWKTLQNSKYATALCRQTNVIKTLMSP